MVHMKRFPRWLAAALVLALALGFFVQAAGAAAPQAGLVEVLIGFRGPADPALVRAMGGHVERVFINFPTLHAYLPARAIEALSRNPNIEYIEPNGTVYALAQETPWGITRVRAPQAWPLGTTGSGVGVAILDTGIDRTHPDLVGRVSDFGVTTVDSTSYFSDKDGHGTHVSGTVAAANNDIGVVGAAHTATLHSVKVLNDSGSGTWSSVAAGLDWVTSNTTTYNIKVANMSLGGSTGSATLANACSAAWNAGVLLVAAAGNSGNTRGTGDNVGYPAKYDTVIAVAASDANNKRASFSSTGPAVELIAPGVGIRSTTTGGGYASWNGTSMASPHVAGVAALMFAAQPGLTNAQARQALRDTALNLGLPKEHQGYGLVQADAAVKAVTGGGEPPPPPPPPPGDQTMSTTIAFSRKANGNLTITVAVTADSNGAVLAGAAVAMSVVGPTRNYSFTGTTGTDGKVSFTIAKAPKGTYVATVTSVTLSGYVWSGSVASGETTV
jgi:subtilisin family serine protease